MRYFVLFALFIPIISFAQSDRWSVGLHYTASQSNPVLTESGYRTKEVQSLMLELPAYGFDAGFHVNYRVVERMEAQLELGYAQIAFAIDGASFFIGYRNAFNNTMSTLKFGNLAAKGRLNFILVNQENWTGYFTAGLSLLHHLDAKHISEVENSDGRETEELPMPFTDYADLSYAYILGIGVERRLGTRMGITLEPMLENGLSPYLYRDGTDQYFENLGCRLAWTYTL